MAVPFSNTKLRVPQGFQCLLEGVAKEVLQMQPNDIFAFSAVYFENLLQLRESGVVDPVAQMSRTQDRMYNNKAFQKPDVDVNNDEQQDAAVKIQTKYRQHQSKGVVDQMRQDKAATKIQAGIRGHLGRRRVANLRKEVAGSPHRSFNAEDGNDLEELAQDDEFNINEDEEETARTQGSIDPELTERVEPEETTVPKSPVKEEDGDIDIDLNDPGVQSAATKIQAGFRGMRTRQNLKPRQNKESKDNVEEDLTARDEVEDSAAFDEAEDVEPRGEEAKRRETPDAKLESRGWSAVPGDISEDESAEMEFSEDDPEKIKAIEEIQDSFRRLKAENENEDNVVESNEQDSLEMEAAATKIQAGFKGMKLRKELKEKKQEKKAINEEPKEIQPEEETDAGTLAAEESSDAELTVAANKIQAGFRGYKTRKEVHRMRREKGEAVVSQEEMKEERDAEEKSDNDEDGEKRAVAASKIQAGFKGYKTRREVEVRRREKAKVSEEKEDEEGREEHVEDEEKQIDAGEEREQEPETQDD